MLGELQSFKWHKGLRCNNSLFGVGPEAWSAKPGSHLWTTAGTSSAPYIQLCSSGLTAKTRQDWTRLHLNFDRLQNSSVTARSIKPHLLIGKPCKIIGHPV